jgi:hypothetical protein
MKKINKMSREELKRLWFSLPISKDKPETKEIIVETEYGHVEIRRDGPDGYSSFKTNQGDNALQYAKDRMNQPFDGYTDYSKYKLIVK